jgi:hypothetical protein
MSKEQRGTLRREDAVENFMMDESSSDDNNTENYLPNGGSCLCPAFDVYTRDGYICKVYFVLLSEISDICTCSKLYYFLQRSRRIELTSSPKKPTL